MPSRRVVVLGDVMLDRTTTVRIRGQSPENAAVLVGNKVDSKDTLGGAANVAVTCKAMGTDVLVLGFNTDPLVDALLAKAGVDRLFGIPATGCTPCKERFFSTDGHYMLRVDHERLWGAVDAGHWTGDGSLQMSLRAQVLANTPEHRSIVAVVDYDKGSVNQAAVTSLMYLHGMIHETYSLPLLVDPGRGGDWGRFSSPETVFKANVLQCQQQYHTANVHGYDVIPPIVDNVDWSMPQSEFTCRTFASRVQYNLSASKVKYLSAVLTLGPNGIVVVSGKNNGIAYIPSEPVENADVCGAGDTVMAVLASYLAASKEPKHEGTILAAAKLACAAARVAVSHRGVYVVNRGDIAWPVIQ